MADDNAADDQVPAAPGAGEFPIASFIGMTIERPGAGRAVARVTANESHHNPHGFVHGSVVFTLVDTSMGAAVMSMLPDGQRCSTIECQVRFLRPVVGADLVCETTVVKPGRRVFHLESRVTTGDGRVVATGTGSFAVIEPAQGGD
ncbi:MAG: PaaI family thioesterase [Acidimicrobiales bacterium]